ncbi:(2Fe-2S)-binding protein [Dankookia sp. P2]|uniref:(2Fe-2S)-binding protein n=1 Tax=Dankookia sp. P2 TaxID=3423955 RepID=UPI003D675A72
MTLQRVLDQDRAELRFHLDGEVLVAREGDTLLTAILAAGAGWLRTSEFGDGRRAGFCLMGACQECWVTVEGPESAMLRRRACGTLVAPGMRVRRT